MAKISQKIIIIKLNYNNKRTRIKRNHHSMTHQRRRLPMTTLLPSSPRSLPRKMRRVASSSSEPSDTRRKNDEFGLF